MRSQNEPRRTKVWLRWNDQDVTAVLHDSSFDDGRPPRYLNLSTPVYAIHQYDAVLLNGEPVGVSRWNTYTPNMKGFASLAMVNEAAVGDGTEVTLVGGRTRRRPTARQRTHRCGSPRSGHQRKLRAEADG